MVWFTGGRYPGPFTPYEGTVEEFLDNGGRLFMSSQDGLDGSAGSTAFVFDYLHINWDGTENQNDKSADPMSLTTVITNPVFSSITGTITVNNAARGFGPYNDWVTPVAPAKPATMDADAGEVNGLSVSDISPVTGKEYRVVFLAFPFEAITSAAYRNAIMRNVMVYFGPQINLPIIAR
jgi:hypothetical protein